MDIVIDLAPAQIGMFVAFTIAMVGIGMACKRRAMRKKKEQKVKREVEEHEFKEKPETSAPERVVKEQPSEGQPKNKPDVDVDALLKDLKEKSEN